MYSGRGSKMIDKTDLMQKIFACVFGDMFAFMHTDETWKAHRKAISHMFFKQKLAIMAGVYKKHLNDSCDKWLAEIAEKGEARVNLPHAFERIFAHTINHICFGEDLNDDKFMFNFFDYKTRTFSERKLSMREAMANISKQCFEGFNIKLNHPIGGPMSMLFGLDFEFGSYFPSMKDNGQRMKNQVLKYVQDRKKGVT